MSKQSSDQSQPKKAQKKHRFFLNLYEDCAFTKCPKCETNTKIRKFPLVIHIKPHQLFVLNKQCKYCTNCDLIIVKKQEIESLMAFGFSQINTEIIGNKYLVLGTIDKKDWKENQKSCLSPHDIMERMFIFADEWNFKVIPAGWYPKE
ncbi:hypothetical protein H6G06_22300 [Anabaena sphaerica FACHB-251]|uniref:Uncharacterized protein n=1 Tax=Anabaena sphaerica FACHB-251 TaxID=2692883 RepID=A0A926WK85_9NOST|nr:hypothetical protein [Anabaena sphaerica]MBD2296133.1 hypothetical protein [Anabaena sphaerica FACHB-251]